MTQFFKLFKQTFNEHRKVSKSFWMNFKKEWKKLWAPKNWVDTYKDGQENFYVPSSELENYKDKYLKIVEKYQKMPDDEIIKKTASLMGITKENVEKYRAREAETMSDEELIEECKDELIRNEVNSCLNKEYTSPINIKEAKKRIKQSKQSEKEEIEFMKKFHEKNLEHSREIIKNFMRKTLNIQEK